MRFKKDFWLTLMVFIFIAVALIIIESRPGFPDPDSFYHAKMATVIRDQGLIKTFPWFQLTDLKNTYVNPHLLYHILLIPFVSLFDPLIGMKISAVIFGLLAFLAIYLSLRAFKTPCPYLFLLFSALSFGLLHRVSLPRAPALSIALLLFITWAILKKRTWIIFFASIVFVWFYHGWPIVFLSLGATTVGNMISFQLNEQKNFFKDLFKGFWQEKKNWLATCGGVIFGLVANPYFPQNIEFGVLDILKIGVINYQSVISVGQEWSPKTPTEFLASSVLIFCAFLFSVAFFVPGLLVSKKRPTQNEMTTALTLVFLAGGYSILTLKSSRFIEYAVPFLTLASGFLFVYGLPFLKKEIWPIFQNTTKIFFLKLIFVSFALSLIGIIAFKNVTAIAKANDSQTTDRLKPAVQWIKENVPEKETIFHNAWDHSLILWYLDDSHYYLVGLDPTFMYDYDPAAYKLWFDLTNGENTDVKKIIDVFNAKTIFIDTKHGSSSGLIDNLETSDLFAKTFDLDGIVVYTATGL